MDEKIFKQDAKQKVKLEREKRLEAESELYHFKN